MAGIKEIEEVIIGVQGILDAAQRAGSESWTLTGNSLTINDKPLADKVAQVLAGIDKVALARESADLSPFEMIKLYRQASDILPKILGH